MPTNNFKNLEWLIKSADYGNAKAQTRLGYIYTKGINRPKDYIKAVSLFIQAANQGYVNAQYNLGIMYETGRGISQNNREAIKWYNKAANQRYANAQYKLGTMYETGKGVSQNNKKAIEWYAKAALQGHVEAKARITNQQGTLERFFNFYGRSSRTEYWLITTFTAILGYINYSLWDTITKTHYNHTQNLTEFMSVIIVIILNICPIILFIIEASVIIRRLHDINRSGWWSALLAIPYVQFIIFIIIGLIDTHKETNQWGLPD